MHRSSRNQHPSLRGGTDDEEVRVMGLVPSSSSPHPNNGFGWGRVLGRDRLTVDG